MWKTHSKHKVQLITGSETIAATPSENAQIPLVRTALDLLLPDDPPTQIETCTFLTDSTLVRYLRARNHDTQRAADMLSNTLLFRRLRIPQPKALCQLCISSSRSHSFYPIGPIHTSDDLQKPSHADVTPLMYSNYDVTDRRTTSVVNHMLWCMEEVFDNHSLHRMVWIMDFHAFSRADLSPSNAKQVLSLFADHYPERLGNAVIYDAPYIFQSLWAAVKLIAAPETVKKVVFVKHNEEERKAKFQALNIKGAVLDRLCREIDEARDKKKQPFKDWWATAPISPIPHYGAKLSDANIQQSS